MGASSSKKGSYCSVSKIFDSDEFRLIVSWLKGTNVCLLVFGYLQGFLPCSFFGCGFRVGSHIWMFLSAFSIYGYVFLGLLVFSMLVCCSDLLDMYHYIYDVIIL